MRRLSWGIALLLALAMLAATGCAADEATGTSPTGTGDADVLMMGRSVMQDWFDYWDGGGSGTVSRSGLTLRYVMLDEPPALGSSAASAIKDAPDGTIVFFKPCFVDFWVSLPGDVDANVNELVGYAEDVVSAADGRNITVILGTALPKVSAESSPLLVKAHAEYAAAIARLADDHEYVVVFDLNGVLAAEDGSLKAEYAVAEDDSHLTDAAYDALDEELFDLLKSLE